MSDAIVVAFITTIGSIIVGIISAVIPVLANKNEERTGDHSKIVTSTAPIILAAILGGCVSCIVGLILVTLSPSQPAISSTSPSPTASTQAPTIQPVVAGLVTPTTLVTPVIPSPSPAAASASGDYSEWLICWHGRSRYEYLIAYPLVDAQHGIELVNLLTERPWDSQVDDLANDSLKACLVDGIWYGQPDNPWFPYVSALRLDKEILVCDTIPGCSGQQWTLKPGSPPPTAILALLRPPVGNTIQVLDHTDTGLVP